jgi:hypothetical protein
VSTLLTKLTPAQREQVLQDGAIFGRSYIYERADGTVEVLSMTRLETYFAPAVPDSMPLPPTEATWHMIAAGSAVLHDMIIEQATMDRGRLWFRDSGHVLRHIWRAMEKARGTKP